MSTNGHGQRLRIAQVAPLHESVPPRHYGGTERVVSYLTEELVAMGHDVTLFASGDSQTTARLVPCCAQALRHAGCRDTLPQHLVMIDEVARRAREFDVIHFHVDYLHLPTSMCEGYAHVTTLHGRLDLPELAPVYRRFAGAPCVSISDAQRAPMPFVAWYGTVLHGFPLELYRPGRGGHYLAFLGRVSPEKGLDRAIEIARRAGRTLRVAAKIDRADRPYYEDVIEPLLRQPHVEMLGEVDERGKQELLGHALALLFPIDWPEPFGMVMPEAMACGTPVIAWRRGSVPEVIDEGLTGIVVDTVDEAVAAVEHAASLSREACRAQFECRFSAARMAHDYVAIYREVLEQRHEEGRAHAGPRGLLHPRDYHAR